MPEQPTNGQGHSNGAPDFASRPKAIEVVNIVKRFGNFTAVDGVSFDVAEGEIFGLLGPNGAGKSTLIRMLTTLVPPTGGTAVVAGHDIIRDGGDLPA